MSSASTTNSVEPDNSLLFHSRRSPVICRHGCVASSQPLASAIGISILQKGGNAADAAVAVAAALAVTEPCSTGLGGDMFCLYYDASTSKVTAINGSGKSPAALTHKLLQEIYPDNNGSIDAERYCRSPHAVTVPGAARGWHDLHSRHGSRSFDFAQLLEPAAVLAHEGFPVAPITSYHWKKGHEQVFLSDYYRNHNSNNPLAISPEPGDIVVNVDLADVLRELGQHGPDVFYEGRIGQAIVAAVQKHGGCLSLDDLKQHTSSEFPDPIAVEYRNCKLWQVPPNGQGIAGLIALSGLQYLEEHGLIPKIKRESLGQASTYHVLMEMMRLGFADARAHVADPDYMTAKSTTSWLLDQERIGQRAKSLFNPEKAVIQGVPDPSSCTVSFQVVDEQGNAISFVNSNYMGFGTGIVPEGCGFSLQNRGFGFTLNDRNHPNCVGPNKRPFHTIIPGILTHADGTNELHSTISNMGGFMQPQGHLQLTVGMLAGNLDPQAAIDMPRFCIEDGTHNGKVMFEQGVDAHVVDELQQSYGHNLVPNICGQDRAVFGRAQIILRDRKTGVLWAGSDGRADGCAIGY